MTVYQVFGDCDVFSCSVFSVNRGHTQVFVTRYSVFLYCKMLMAYVAQVRYGMLCAPARLQRNISGMEAILQLLGLFRRSLGESIEMWEIGE